MAISITPLTDSQIKNAKHDNKTKNTLRDGGGLILDITATSKLWRFKYKRPFTKKENRLSLGAYPETSLAEARKLRDEYRKLIKQGTDPQAYLQAKEREQAQALANTFKAVFDDWLEHRQAKLKPLGADSVKDLVSRMERLIFPIFGAMPIGEITAPAVIEVLKPLQASGKLETLRRTIAKINEVMAYALRRGIIAFNPLVTLREEFDSPIVTHFKSIRPEELPVFFDALNKASINLQTRYLILWQMLTMTRPAEAATAKYSDIDEAARTWTITVKKGNTETAEGRKHRVTLSTHALALLREIKLISGNKAYLFPNSKNPSTHCNTQTANAAIKRMGFNGKLVAHGLRAIASTYLNERGFNKDVIEVALSHGDDDKVRAAYNRAEYLSKRFELLQAWGDYVAECSRGSLPEFHLKFA